MLTDKDIIENKTRFLQLINGIERDGFKKELLTQWLGAKSDFFDAPASTVYHAAYVGGLCQHCLNVYDNLVKIVDALATDEEKERWAKDNSLVLVALLHDLSKTNFYEIYYRNQKVYSDTGSKHDEVGKFDWAVVKAFKVKEDPNILVGTHEATAYYMAEKFVSLNPEETAAILNHMGGTDCSVGAAKSIPQLYARYHLAMYLHMADLAATCSE